MRWWQRRSGRIVAGFDALCVCAVVSIVASPALAETIIPIPFINAVINIGDIPPWIMAGVVLVTWWEARSARKEARTIGVKIDGMLVERDKAKVKEGEAKEAKAGEDKAAILAEGQRQGREMSAKAQPLTPSGDGKGPLPVADDRTAVAAERGASANERIADAAESTVEKKLP